MDDKIQKKLAQRLASKRRTRRVDQRKSWFWVKQFLLGIFDASLLLLIGVVGYVGYLFYSTPKAELIHRPIAQTSVIYDQSGEHVLYKIHGEENRKVVSHDQISDEIRVATIATEDDSFYSHFGIDPLAILRALRVNFQENDLRQGASTITQQLARNVFLTREKSWKRKILEAVLAIKIETRYSKDEILDFYLNEVPYGSNAYGIQSAAEIYFGKNAADLTLEEATLLAALNKAPTYYSPYGNHADELVVRQGMILRRVEELGLRDQTVVTTARQSDALARVIPFREAIEAPHFVFFVREQLEKLYGREAVEEGGLRVITTLDYDMQKNAERIVREAVAQSGPQHGFHNAALLALNPRSGAIQAMVGSKDFFDERDDGQVNVTIRPRQPGSSFKPIVYATAFEKGYQPETLFFDAPTNFGPDGSGKDYIPQNYSGKFTGLVSMRQALSRSLNIPAIKALYLAGIPQTIALAEKLGITTLTRKNDYGLSLAIGGGEVTLLDEVGAFSVFANDGVRNPAYAIQKITKADGSVIVAHESDARRVIGEETARKIDSILSDNASRTAVFGPRSPLFVPGFTVAAKTGTTQDFKDAWTVGFTRSIAVGVWAGNNDGTLMRPGSDGVFVAAPIWRSFMDTVLAVRPDEPFPAYLPVSSETPMLTGKLNQRLEYFNNKSGKKLSEEKMKKTDPEKISQRLVAGEVHDILFYVNKDNPLGLAGPNRADPMLARWERGVNGALNPEEEKKKDEKK